MRVDASADKENVAPFNTTTSTASSPAKVTPTRPLRVSWSQSNSHHPYSNACRSLPSANKLKDPPRSILKKPLSPIFPMEDVRQLTPEPDDVLNDRLYLMSPVRTLLASLDDTNSISLHDLREAYGVLAARVKVKLDAQDAATDHPVFEPIRFNAENLVEVLARDLARCFVDPTNLPRELALDDACMSELPMSSSPLREGQRRGMSDAEIKFARDLYTVCHGAMRLLSSIFSMPALHSVFTEQQLGELLTHLLAIPLAPSMPTPNSRKTYALAVFVLQQQQLPAAVLDPAKPRITYAFSRAIEGQLGKEGKKGAATDALHAVFEFLQCYPAEFLDSFVDLIPSILPTLLSPSPAIRTQAIHAFGAFAMAETNFLKNIASFQDTMDVISKHVDTYISQLHDSRKNANDTCVLAKALKATLASDAIDNKLTGPIWGCCILASVIVLSGGQLFQRPRSLRLVLTAFPHINNHKVMNMRGLGRLLWRCLVWACLDLQRQTDMMEDGEERVEAQKKCDSSWKITRQVVDGGVGTAMIMSVLWDRSRRGVQRALEVVDAMVKTSGGTHAAGVDILRRLTSAIGRPQAAEGPSMRPEEALIYCGFFDGNLMSADAQFIATTLQQVPKVTGVRNIRTLSQLEVEQEWPTLLAIWQAALEQTELWAKSTLATSLLDIWQALLLAGKAPTLNSVDMRDMDKHVLSILKSCLADSGGILDGFPLDQKFHIAMQLWTVVHAVCDNSLCLRVVTPFLDLVQNIDISSEPAPIQESWARLCGALLVASPLARARSALDQKDLDLDVKRQLWAALGRAWNTLEDADAEAGMALLQLPLCTWGLIESEWAVWNCILQNVVVRAENRGMHAVAALDQVCQAITAITTDSLVLMDVVQRLLVSLSFDTDIDAKDYPNNILALTGDVLCRVYPPPSGEDLDTALDILQTLTRVLGKLSASTVLPAMETLHQGLTFWSQDAKCAVDDVRYAGVVIPLYTACLSSLLRVELTFDHVCTFAPLFSSTFDRILQGAVGPTAFMEFWQEVYPKLGRQSQEYPDDLIPCLKSLSVMFNADLGVSIDSQTSEESCSSSVVPDSQMSADEPREELAGVARGHLDASAIPGAWIGERVSASPGGSDSERPNETEMIVDTVGDPTGASSRGAGISSPEVIAIMPRTPPRHSSPQSCGLDRDLAFFVDTSVAAERSGSSCSLPTPDTTERPRYAPRQEQSPTLASRSVLGKRRSSSSILTPDSGVRGIRKRRLSSRRGSRSESIDSPVEDSIIVDSSPLRRPLASVTAARAASSCSSLSTPEQTPTARRLLMEAVEVPSLGLAQKRQHVQLPSVVQALRPLASALSRRSRPTARGETQHSPVQ